MHTAGLLPFIRLLAVPDQGWLDHLMGALMLLETARSHILLDIFIGASAERADAEICGFRIRTTRNCYSLIPYREAGLPVCEATKSLGGHYRRLFFTLAFDFRARTLVSR